MDDSFFIDLPILIIYFYLQARCEFDGPYCEEEIEVIKATESTTMFINFSHVMRYNDFLHQTISDEYSRFEPYLRSAFKRFLMEQKQSFMADDNPNRDFNVFLFQHLYTEK